MDERELIYDWNRAGGAASFDWTRARVDLNDETLRDGLQSPSVRDPALDVTSGGADALVREQAREGVLHGLHTNPLDGGGREGDTSSWMSAS